MYAPPVRVLVTGATGFLGAHLVEVLLREGHDLVAFARPSSRTEAIEAQGVRVARGAFDDAESLRRAAASVDAIVHAAGGGIVRELRDYYDGNTESTRALLRAAPSTLARFVLISSVAAHGPSERGRPANEGIPDAPRSHYGRSKRAAELATLRSGLPATLLRPPALYGPGEHRMVPLFRAASRGVVPMVHPSGTLSLLSGADCAEAVARALAVPHPSGVYYVAEPEPMVRSEMAQAIGRAVTGRDVRVLAIPAGGVRTGAAIAEGIGRWRGEPSHLNRDKARDMTAPHQSCDPSLAMRALGWRATERFATSAPAIAEAYRRRGWL